MKSILSLLYIQKLRDKQAQDVERFKTLQDIVESEIEAGTTLAKNSATDALLWLKRFVKKKTSTHEIFLINSQYIQWHTSSDS